MFTQHKIKQLYQITFLQEKLKVETISPLHSDLLTLRTIES